MAWEEQLRWEQQVLSVRTSSVLTRLLERLDGPPGGQIPSSLSAGKHCISLLLPLFGNRTEAGSIAASILLDARLKYKKKKYDGPHIAESFSSYREKNLPKTVYSITK